MSRKRSRRTRRRRRQKKKEEEEKGKEKEKEEEKEEEKKDDDDDDNNNIAYPNDNGCMPIVHIKALNLFPLVNGRVLIDVERKSESSALIQHITAISQMHEQPHPFVVAAEVVQHVLRYGHFRSHAGQLRAALDRTKPSSLINANAITTTTGINREREL